MSKSDLQNVHLHTIRKNNDNNYDKVKLVIGSSNISQQNNDNEYDNTQLIIGTPAPIPKKISDGKKQEVSAHSKDVMSSVYSHRSVKMLKKIGDKAMGYRWMHDQESEYYLRWEYFFRIISIVLSTTLAALTSSSILADVSDYAKNAFNITILVLSIVVGIVVGIKDFGDFKVIAIEHKNIAAEYASLYHSIQKEFALDKNRLLDDIFFNDIVSSYDNLQSDAPMIRRKTLSNYAKIMDTERPLVDDLDKIEISIDKTTDIKQKSEPDLQKKYEIERWLRQF
jgi:hypothetical protein